MNMKTRKYINLLSTGIIGLTLCACGGGGGGGGGSDAAPGQENNHQQATTDYAPQILATDDEFVICIGTDDEERFTITAGGITGSWDNGSMKGTYEYSYQGTNKAQLTRKAYDMDRDSLALTFTSAIEGYLIDRGSQYRFSYTPATPNTNTNGNHSGSGTTASYAPASLDGFCFTATNNGTTGNIQKIGFAEGKVTISPANVSGTYTYTKSASNGNEAKITINCTGSDYDSTGELTLSFSSATQLRMSGKINGSDFDMTFNMAQGKVEIDNTSGGNTSGGNTSGGNTSGGNTSGGNTSGGTTQPSTPTYLAPSGLKGLKLCGYGREYYYFIYDGAMEYNDGYTLFTGASCTYTRTGYTTGTLTFKYAHSYTGTPYLRTEKIRESSGTINLTFYMGSDNKLKVRMEGRVRETTRTEDLTEWPADITTNYRTISITGEYRVE